MDLFIFLFNLFVYLCEASNAVFNEIISLHLPLTAVHADITYY